MGWINYRQGSKNISWNERQVPGTCQVPGTFTVELPVEPITAEEMYKCLKRIRDSIRKWTKRAGRQGYLTYLDQFFPRPPDAEQ